MQSLMILIALLTWIVTKNLIENDIYIELLYLRFQS